MRTYTKNKLSLHLKRNFLHLDDMHLHGTRMTEALALFVLTVLGTIRKIIYCYTNFWTKNVFQSIVSLLED